MREIPKKNYIFLALLILATVLLTLILSNIYLNKEKKVSNIYNNINEIKPNDFDEYFMEYSDLIVYISDKYDLSNETFEEKFEKKLENLNLKNIAVFMDKNEMDKKFLSKLNDEYNIDIDINNTPLIIVVVDKEFVKSVSVSDSTDVDTVINYEEFR